MSYFDRIAASFHDSANLDAFSRLRVSNLETLFSSNADIQGSLTFREFS